jgi:hypothetical protein
MRRLLVAAVLVSGVGLGGCDLAPDYVRAFFNKSTLPKNVAAGSFKGQAKVVFLEPKKSDDRNVQLFEPFGYKDSKGNDWDVPAGFVSNGASIPWSLWTFIGGPFDGPYRDAAIIHDYFCESKTRTWEETHAMFLEASLRRGVTESVAQTMYAGILYGGPRWPAPLKEAQILAQTESKGPVGTGVTKREATKSEKEQFEDLRRWIEQMKPTAEQIQKRVEEMRKAHGMPVKK